VEARDRGPLRPRVGLVLTDWLIREFSDGVRGHRHSDSRLLAAQVQASNARPDPGLMPSWSGAPSNWLAASCERQRKPVGDVSATP
jgi:hypothetical protein